MHPQRCRLLQSIESGFVFDASNSTLHTAHKPYVEQALDAGERLERGGC